MQEILTIFSFDFMRNAIIAGTFVAVSCAVVGVFLVLRKFSMIGDGLAHTSLATIALGMFIGISPIAISIPLVIVASLYILWLTKKTAVWGDSAIGFVSTTAVAIAVMLASLSQGVGNLHNYLFGNILAIQYSELWISLALSVAVISVVVVFYREFFMLTFDEDFARVQGVKADFLNGLIIVLTAIIVVLGVRVVGAMLISALIIIPTIAALQVSKSFKQTIVFSVAFAVFSVNIGIFVSFVLDVPTGATIVLMNTSVFLACLGFKAIKRG